MTVRKKFKSLLMHSLCALAVAGFPTAHGAAEDPVQILKSGDVERASKLLRELAETGDRDAQYALGVIYYRGDLGSVDNAEATQWFRKAAEQNHLEAMFNLGIAYWEGRGVEQDFAESFRWWRRAAELNYPPAQHNLATVYYMGKGTEKDLPLALAWFKRAAENGHSEAQEILTSLSEITDSDPDTPSTASETVSSVSGSEPVASVPDSETMTPVPDSKTMASDTDSKTMASDDKPQTGSDPAQTVADMAPSGLIYAFPSTTAPGIGELSSTIAPKEIGRENDWVEVVLPRGALVWVYGKFVDSSSGDDAFAVITGTSVRMRPSPSTGVDSPPMGSFEQGESVEIVEERGDWKRVRVAGPVAGWIKSSDFERL